MSAFRSPGPFGKTAAFVNEATEKRGAAWAKSWLSQRTCRFTDDTILTTGLGADRLHETCEALLKKHGVKAKYDADVTAMFYKTVPDPR